MSHKHALSINGEGLLNVLISDVGVSLPFSGKPEEPEKLEVKTYKGIWDTGATGSVITKKVADELGLVPTGQTDVHTASGTESKNTYLVNIYLPMNVSFQVVKVTEAVLNGNIEMLIGMDIITSGDFTLTHCEGRTKMNFGIPSVKNYDYVDSINVNNKSKEKQRMCECGRGKKYVYCCGRGKK